MKILEKIIVSGKEKGKYKAFPTVVNADRATMIAFREGMVDITTPHGVNGCVKLTEFHGLEFHNEFKTPFCDSELDAILSNIDDNLFLITRSYNYKDKSRVYISRFSKHSKPLKRRLIHINNADFAVFGHIFRYENELITTAYGKFNGASSPFVLCSFDFGETWDIKSLITPKGHNPVLNETTIVKKDGVFYAVMRSQEPSYDLYIAKSKNLVDWSLPKNIRIKGHAPVIKLLSDKRAVFVFRDLNSELPGVSLAVSGDCESWNILNICRYTGGLYNGGYADFVEIEPGILFIVYYISDEDNEPWIEAALVKI